MTIFAAIRLNNCIIYGKHHAECIKRAVEEFGFETPIGTRTGGFLTNTYRFVFREEAKQIAVRAGQVTAHRLNSNRVFVSEEIWSEETNGCCHYDPEKGYQVKLSASALVMGRRKKQWQ